MKEIARRQVSQLRGEVHHLWPNKARFVDAVLARAREQIRQTDWPWEWKQWFLHPEIASAFVRDERTARARAQTAAAATTALAAVAKTHDDSKLLDLARATQHELARAEQCAVFDMGSRRSRLIAYMAVVADRELEDVELALMSLVSGWATEVRSGWEPSSSKSVAAAIQDERRAIARARKVGRRTAHKTLTADLGSRMIEHASTTLAIRALCKQQGMSLG